MATFIIGNKKKLSHQIAEDLKNLVKEKPNAILCLPTGNSPIDFYEKVVELYNKGEISLKDVASYNLDEYLDIDVDTTPYSFKNFMKEHLFSKTDLKNYNFPEDVESYNQKLDSFDKFDFTLIGVGTNGHIAFNEPGTSEDIRTNIVELTPETIKANFKDSKDHPTRAITMGMQDIIFKSKRINILAFGESKLEALKKFKKGIKDNKCPITLLINQPNVYIYTDLEEFKPKFAKVNFFLNKIMFWRKK